jgi:ATP-dependent helicase YprA (DUF1998 family)
MSAAGQLMSVRYSLWQQAGRAGRRGRTSLSIYVAWDSPLDQVQYASSQTCSRTLNPKYTPTDSQAHKLLYVRAYMCCIQ